MAFKPIMRKALPLLSNTAPRLCPRTAVAAPLSIRHHSNSSMADNAHKVHIGQGMASPNTVGLPRDTKVGNKRFADFDLMGRTFIVTGGAQGLGLATAEALVEAGARGMSSTSQILTFLSHD
jgi:thiamine monophosphate synthase